jgi:hypothetical protein
MNWLKNRVIPVPHGAYSAEALLTMVFSARDLPGDAGSQINALCEKLKAWGPMDDGALDIVNQIQALTDSKLDIPTRGNGVAAAPGKGRSIDKKGIPEWDSGELGDAAPGGMAPGIFIVIDTLSWLRGDDKRKSGAIEALTTGKENKSSGKPQLRKSPRDFISYCLKQGADMVVDWVFNAMKEDGFLKVAHLHSAVADGDAAALMTAMREWGLENEEGVIKGTKASKKAADDTDIKESLKSVKVRTSTGAKQHVAKETAAPAVEPKNPVRQIIEDGKKMMSDRDKVVTGSASAVFKGLMHAYRYLHKEGKLERMAGHIAGNTDNKVKAIKPLLKTFAAVDNLIAKSAVAELIMADKVSVKELSVVFTDNEWGPIYESLSTWMVTRGPAPPPEILSDGLQQEWLSKS